MLWSMCGLFVKRSKDHSKHCYFSYKLFDTLQYFWLSFSLSCFWLLSSPVCLFNSMFVFPRSSIRSSTSLVLLMVSPTTLLKTYLLMVNVKPNTSLSTSRSGLYYCKNLFRKFISKYCLTF